MKLKNYLVLFLSLLLIGSTLRTTNVFAEDYLPGVTVELNDDPQYEAKYKVTFVYENSDNTITNVAVRGGFQFYKGNSTTCYNAYEYENGMYAGGYEYDTSTYILYDMEEKTTGNYSVTLPLPANLYFYDYWITYSDGSTKNVKDPANLPVSNGGRDANWSLVYVGDATTAASGQEYIYPRSDKAGNYSFVEYEAIDGTTQPLGVYLPYNYNPNKLYKTIYISHGGWGNEVEWFTIGSAGNIMDNLIAEGLTDDAIVVTMNNDVLGFNGDKPVENLVNCIIPYIEENYSVSKNKDNRAICGLSAGGTFSCNTLIKYTDMFGYYGIWSPRDTVLAPLIQNGAITEFDDFKDAIYHVGVGNLDIDLRKTQEELLHNTLESIGADSTFEYVDGTHDWFVWRHLLTNFVKDILWSKDSDLDIIEGVVIEENKNSNYVADYQATFTYLASKEVKSVNLVGGFQFYSQEDASNYMKSYSATTTSVKSAYEYEVGMFASGYNVAGGGTIPYTMEEIENRVYSITIPLPANEYYYGYEITYKDGTVKTIEDPANLSISNGGHTAGWSYFFVGSGADSLVGQEYIYPRTDGNTGTCIYVSYPAIDGTMQPLGIYLPKNYNVNKTYKTIYLSHGASGNEVEWFQLGAASNIMDNLIYEGLTEEAIIVTMDNNYFNNSLFWDWKLLTDNLMDYIIPYVESHFSVSSESSDRAFAGLSNGSRLTSSLLYSNAEDFGYFGLFSRALTDVDLNSVPGIKDVEIYFSIGSLEYNAAIDEWREMMKEAGIDYSYELYDSAHDWNMWRASFTTFVKDICWSVDNIIEPEPPIIDNKDTDVSNPIIVTGDSNNLETNILALSISLLGVTYCVYTKKKERKKIKM